MGYDSRVLLYLREDTQLGTAGYRTQDRRKSVHRQYDAIPRTTYNCYDALGQRLGMLAWTFYSYTGIIQQSYVRVILRHLVPPKIRRFLVQILRLVCFCFRKFHSSRSLPARPYAALLPAQITSAVPYTQAYDVGRCIFRRSMSLTLRDCCSCFC